ncbi:SOS response-associated peptidase family protein [Brevundimonas sp.]|uniref:SOS response-associated peptidase family protein n=1 Tax=Brevundimonas sp. TaxID=1871086 RepID=UPI002D309B7A|nr:SOS response-associated peptidase family protein [Brevundimonas sp.]HYD28586.1 SOS response-associated peptidase family protein [Brevundimonas sp.]
MCASYEARFSVTQLVEAFDRHGAPLRFPGGLPNIEPVEEVRPTDLSRAVRAADSGTAELVEMRFGFPPPAPKRPPVINFRSEGRRFSNGPTSGRALVPVSGFYEFTGDKYPKTRWILRGADQPFVALAAIWRGGAEGAADAFSLLTAEPGPDVAPYHDRGVLPLAPQDWADWLFDRRPAEDLLKPPPAGTLAAAAAPRPPRT